MAKEKMKVQMRTGKKNPSNGEEIYRKLDPSKLHRKPLSDWYRFKDKLVNVENYVYHATALFQKGVAIKKDHVAELFTSGYNDEGFIWNTANDKPLSIGKQGKFLTNMATGGEFDNTTNFYLEEIAVELFLTSEPCKTWTNGAIIEPDHVPISSYSAANHYYAMTRQFNLAFVKGENDLLKEGGLYQFPCTFVASGAFGAANSGFIQNGFAATSWNVMDEVHALESQERFRYEIRPLVDGFIPQVNIALRVLMIGTRVTSHYA